MSPSRLGKQEGSTRTRPVHIVLVRPNGSFASNLAICGLPIESFQHTPSREDRVCQRCVLASIGMNPL